MLYSEQDQWGIAVIHHIVENDDHTFSVMAHINVEWCDYCDEAREGKIPMVKGTSYSTSGPHQYRAEPYSHEKKVVEEEERASVWAHETNRTFSEVMGLLLDDLDLVQVAYDPHRAMVKVRKALVSIQESVLQRDHDLIILMFMIHEEHEGLLDQCEHRVCRTFRSQLGQRRH